MKIIKNNNTIEVTCQQCKSVLAVTIEDIDYEVIFNYYYIDCLACGQETSVSLKMMPSNWWPHAQEKAIRKIR